jgi:hypothetical protein
LKKESDIPQNMPATRSSFPMRYFGLPLSVLHLKCVDFQPLKDKMASKLVTWWVDRYYLEPLLSSVKSALSSQTEQKQHEYIGMKEPSFGKNK